MVSNLLAMASNLEAMASYLSKKFLSVSVPLDTLDFRPAMCVCVCVCLRRWHAKNTSFVLVSA